MDTKHPARPRLLTLTRHDLRRASELLRRLAELPPGLVGPEPTAPMSIEGFVVIDVEIHCGAGAWWTLPADYHLHPGANDFKNGCKGHDLTLEFSSPRLSPQTLALPAGQVRTVTVNSDRAAGHSTEVKVLCTPAGSTQPASLLKHGGDGPVMEIDDPNP